MKNSAPRTIWMPAMMANVKRKRDAVENADAPALRNAVMFRD
jgi:hypothetical protein